LYDEAVRRTVVWKFPFLGIMPLQVEFDTIASDAGVFWSRWVIAKCDFEAELSIESDRRLDVA